jgi:hypothetical protein
MAGKNYPELPIDSGKRLGKTRNKSRDAGILPVNMLHYSCRMYTLF